MTDSKSEQLVRDVLTNYVEGCRTGDVDLLKKIFHSEAVMNGYLAGTLMVGGPDTFFDAVAANPSPADSGQPYHAEISDVRLGNNMATGTLTEEGFMGLNFTNHFQLICIDGNWTIIAKLFESH